MNRMISLSIMLLFFAGCDGENQPQSDILLHIHTNTTETGELWISINGSETIRLLYDAQGYRPLISPDGEWLAVEVRLMSDLEVVRLFRRAGDRFVIADKDVTAVAWRHVTNANKIEMQDLENTKARVSGWGDQGTDLRLELSALGPGELGLIETIVSVPLDHQP